MSSGLLIIPNFMPALDRNGRPINGALIHVYDHETTDLATIYADKEMSVELQNPVEADASGVFPLIYAPFNETYTVTTSGPTGQNPKTYDDVTIGVIIGEPGPDTEISLARYGFAEDNTEAQNLAAINAWVAAINAHEGPVVANAPAGTYLINETPDVINHDHVTLRMWGSNWKKTASCTALRIYRDPNSAPGARIEHLQIFGFSTEADEDLPISANGIGLDLDNVCFALVYGGLHWRAELGLSIKTFQEVHVRGNIEFWYNQDAISHNFGDSLFISDHYIRGADSRAEIVAGRRGIVSLDGGGIVIGKGDIILCDFGHHAIPGDTRGGATPGAYVAIVTYGDGCFIDTCTYGVVAEKVPGSNAILPQFNFTPGCRLGGHTYYGAVLKGIRSLKIGCEVHGNGNDGMLIQDSNDIQITSASFSCNNSNDLPHGAGLKLVNCKDVQVVATAIKNDPAFLNYQAAPAGEADFQYHAINFDKDTSDLIVTGCAFGRGHLSTTFYRPTTDASQVIHIAGNSPRLVAGNNPDEFAMVHFGTGNTAIAAGQTKYLTSGGTIDAVNGLPFVFDKPRVITGFRVEIATGPGVGETFTYQVMHNGVAAAGMTGSITGTATFSLEVAADSFVAAATDRVVLRVVASAAAATSHMRGSLKTEG